MWIKSCVIFENIHGFMNSSIFLGLFPLGLYHVRIATFWAFSITSLISWCRNTTKALKNERIGSWCVINSDSLNAHTSHWYFHFMNAQKAVYQRESPDTFLFENKMTSKQVRGESVDQISIKSKTVISRGDCIHRRLPTSWLRRKEVHLEDSWK